LTSYRSQYKEAQDEIIKEKLQKEISEEDYMLKQIKKREDFLYK